MYGYKMYRREELKKNTKEAKNMKSDLIRTISHEVKTPLNLILGAADLLSIEDDENELAKLSKDSVEIIKRNCFRLVKLADNFIDINKMDLGSMHLNLENHNIVSIVEDIALSVVRYASRKGIRLTFDTDVEERIVACDIEALERIVLNLLSNAIKFTGFGGKIQIEIKDHVDSITISIKDSGVGIPKDMADTIFDKFEQVDTSLTRKQEGSGIGLSIVKSLVKLHGGKISLNSELDKGTEFIIELPIKLIDQKDRENKFHIDKGGKIDKIQIEFSDIYELI